ncbi:M50 family metallopeptidase [Paenarthrobacter ureafaciens]|uniref:M50 family metallopeptidase n=1 Tax=Paenarthrobacter ureafaciens TaxID=37931 RepID=UPI00226400E2|nr:M50 family metallopeptidase [Paenarthrobacter ureafaciens]MCX8455985.1 M50 family metallopeptidase [Paenarthrobacter ureafaciens]MCY0975069.1 M50 family metallopeptidase [Paenarthrobacter ureafaciens]
MSHATGGPRPEAGPPPSSPASLAPASPEEYPQRVPARAEGVQLLGRAEGSGYRDAPALVRRADGQTLQLTPLLYLVLEAVDGARSMEDIAEHASRGSGRLVSADNVRTLIDSQLLPMGVLRLANGSEPAVKKADPLLGMRFRYTVTDPERTRRITAPFAALFHPLIVAAVALAFLASCWWVLMIKGLGSATHEAFANPALLLLIFAITILSAGFHEFGHAAAARKGGATPGAMGAGLYLVWPAFYTDVTDSYRLGRGGRLRTDLGGLYFNAIVAVAIMGLWWATGFDALLLVVATQILQMVRQLLPLVRFDGYHILADATGVPDLFQRIKPTLLGLLPWNWGRPENRVLKPWARAVVSIWVLITVPLLLFSLVLMVLALPRLLATAWDSLLKQQEMFSDALSAGDVTGATLRVLAMAAVVLPMLGMLYIVVRLLRQLVAGLWRKTSSSVLQRTAAMGAVVALFAGLAWAWWPDGGTYRPVQPYERGTLVDATTSVFPNSAGTSLREGGSRRTVALWPSDAPKPTREHPQLSMVLVPVEGSSGSADASQSIAPSWVFPFDRPAAPEDGDNQALAVNTTDGSVTYSVAFALVWAEDGEPVDNRNDAYAFANCSGCAAVAVAFQVVLIVGQTDVVVPENLSAAANYNCLDCLTYALASQLVLTLDGPLGDASREQLSALWAEIAEYGRNIRNVPVSEIQGRLTAYKEKITAIIRNDPSATRKAGQATAPTDAATPTTTLTGTAPATQVPDGPAPAPSGSAPASAPVQQPTPDEVTPSFAPDETVQPTGDVGGALPEDVTPAPIGQGTPR